MNEIRQNIATKEWVIIATERAKRPEEFSKTTKEENTISFDQNCPFCPGNESKTPSEIYAYREYGSQPNTPGWWVRVIPNKFSAVTPECNVERTEIDNFFKRMDGYGFHEVVIETPVHNLLMANMDDTQIEEIFLMYRDRFSQIQCPNIRQIIIFKNHGKMAGTSLVHPHSQIIALPVVPIHIRHKLEEALRYYDDTGKCVYCHMTEEEMKERTRIIYETYNFVSFAPFASRFPFETWVVPKRHNACFGAISLDETKEVARFMKVILRKIYIGLNNPDFNFVIHCAPIEDSNKPHYHWHIKIIPRITIAAGFELGTGMYINISLPEECAKFLREIQ